MLNCFSFLFSGNNRVLTSTKLSKSSCENSKFKTIEQLLTKNRFFFFTNRLSVFTVVTKNIRIKNNYLYTPLPYYKLVIGEKSPAVGGKIRNLFVGLNYIINIYKPISWLQKLLPFYSPPSSNTTHSLLTHILLICCWYTTQI